MSTPLLTTAEAADRLGLTVRAVQKMIEAGRLSAQKMGRDYFIAPDALNSIPKQAAGRPPKAQANGPSEPAKITAKLNATKKRSRK